MFCSKCGKEIRDDAVFCDKCGAKMGSTGSEGYSNTDSVTSEEKVKKILAIALFVLYAIIALGAVFSLLSQESELLKALVNTSYMRRLEEVLSEYSILLKVLVIVSVVVSAVSYYIIPYVKRDFDGSWKKVLIAAISDSIIPIIPVVMIMNSDVAEYISLNPTAYILYAVYVVVVIFRAICYKRAASEESNAYYYSGRGSENKLLSKIGSDNSDWECRHCGSLNKANQDYCK